MALKYGSTSLYPGVIPAATTSAQGCMLLSDGTEAYWNYPGNPDTNVGSGFRYRSIFTHGFLAGGYKGYNPWRSVNKTWYSTDITAYVGEELDRAAEYVDGCFSDYNGYVMGANNQWAGTGAATSSINLHNGTRRSRGTSGFSSSGVAFGYQGNNPKGEGLDYGTAGYGGDVGGWDMHVARRTMGCSSNQIGQNGYTTGGGSAATDKLHFPTEIMYTTNSNPYGSGYTTAASGETGGWFTFDNRADGRMTYSNDTWSAWARHLNSNAWGHILSSKHGHHYGGRDNVTIEIEKFRDSDGTLISTFNKVRSYGEENYLMGQDWGYMLGQYDGQQNNHTVKTNYITDTQTQMGAATQPKGHYGQSSGACMPASATITSATQI